MTTNKSNHANCYHPKTKAARATCRKQRAAWAKEDAAWETEKAELQKDREAEALWNETFPMFAAAHQASAHQNADDTASEEGFDLYSRRWYESALSTIEHARDCAERLYDRTDPQEGQSFMVKGGTDYLWVDGLNYENGWAKSIVAVDRQGIRSTVELADIDLDD